MRFSRRLNRGDSSGVEILIDGTGLDFDPIQKFICKFKGMFRKASSE